MPNPKTREYPRCYTPIGGPSLTKQSFKDECNINKIMEKFQKTGAIQHYSTYAEEYGDATHIELHQAMLVVANSESMFEELPSSIRKKFNNDPGQFLEFVQDEKNLEEMRNLGLAEKHSSLSSHPDAKLTQSDNAPASTEGETKTEE